MLVKHRIDDVDKSLVAIEQPVPAREKIPLEPTFALMLGEHLHDPAFGCEKLIILFHPGFPLPVGYFKNGVQPVGKRLVGTEDPEIALLPVELGHIAQENSELVRVGGLN